MIDPENPDYSNTPASPNRPDFDYEPVDPSAAAAITIITPFYNTGEIFRETSLSVLRQSLQQWEWLIINDGSSDPQSLKILDEYRNSDPRIRVIDHPLNLGLSAARNTGFREAKTKYGLLLDSDDLLEPTVSEKWFWFLESHPENAFVGSYLVGFGANEHLWQSGFQDAEANLKRNRIVCTALIRKSVHQAVGGFDETMREGLEDWEFWLHCANQGFWGTSIPEYLFWYRTRPTHTDHWENLREERVRAYQKEFRNRYPGLWQGNFPQIEAGIDLEYVEVTDQLPFRNSLKKNKQRLLIIAPWLVMGGAEKFNLDLMKQLSTRGWEITIVTTSPAKHSWLPEFEKITPDIFILDYYVNWADSPRFIKYLIQSRQIDVALITASPLGYRLLPYLRIQFPNLPILDYVHMVIPYWMNGGYARLSAQYHPYLDLSIAASSQVKEWLVSEGAEEERTRICTVNVDTAYWQPDPVQREIMRKSLGISESDTLILYVARIAPQKQPNVFIKTLLHLHQQNLPFTALVIGDGPLMKWLKSFIKKNKLQNRVKLVGAIPVYQVKNWMQAGDIIFLPSKMEGISITLYEGMSCGLAPVGADVGGQRELITPECGFLLPTGSEDEEVQQYSQILEDLIHNSTKRKQMGNVSRMRIVSHFRLDQMVEQMENLFTEAKQMVQDHPRDINKIQLAFATAKEIVEYSNAKQEYSRLWQSCSHLVENPSPATYLYYAIREALLPIYNRFLRNGYPQVIQLKEKFKALLLR